MVADRGDPASLAAGAAMGEAALGTSGFRSEFVQPVITVAHRVLRLGRIVFRQFAAKGREFRLMSSRNHGSCGDVPTHGVGEVFPVSRGAMR